NQVNGGSRRLLKARVPGVEKALRLDPFLVETALHILAVRDQLSRASHLANFAQQQRLCRGVELCVALFVQLKTRRLDSSCMDNVGGSAVPLPKQCPGLSAHELRQVLENATPRGPIEDGLIDIANEGRDTVQFRHA